ncbi:hypothetical protein SHO565_58350 [Streptomyces sp. HO565]
MFAACWLPLLVPLPAPVVLAAVMLPGALFVPVLTVARSGGDRAGPAGDDHGGGGWMSSAIRLGLAAGTALAGPLDGHFALPLMAAAVGALVRSARTHTPASAPAAA